ncbi:hypothetical protein MMC18_004798 [Xylographa bjoerkii]|nr:hypothetical protein [Xylographa bjoerkii]
MQIVYYSYSFSDPTKRKAITAFRLLALQLLTHNQLIPDKVLQLYEIDVANHVFLLRDPHTVTSVLQALLKQCSRVHIMLDGLDECYDRTLTKTLFAPVISQKRYGIVKLFFTSRNDHDLQPLMQIFHVIDIVPPKETILGDIRKYLQESMMLDDHSEERIDYWTAASEGNFLWMTLTLGTLKGMDPTCDSEIEEERIFAVLVVANQPFRLNELLNALSTREGAQDFSRKRALKPSLIEELVGQLVIVDRVLKTDETDPFIKFAHKSIYDFFIQSPKALGAPDRLGKFFVDIPLASLELGRTCLTYLSYSRYQDPVDILASLVDDPEQEHAFVKYAATFWFWHLMSARHWIRLISVSICQWLCES